MTLLVRILRSRWAVPLLIGIAVFVSFAPALDCDFVKWDDDFNFLNNPNYRGLGPSQLSWMFRTTLMGHWHPLTWITLGLDYSLWGMKPFGYHLTSLALHAANAGLLYLVLLALLDLSGTPDARWPAAAGALLYALHPLRVESAVWITERRDVLCGFFALLSILFYLKRVAQERADRPSLLCLVLSVVAFGASLMSKALSIMLPAALLILDLYPLGRFVPGSRKRLLLEKIPYGLLAAVDLVMMRRAMSDISAVRSVTDYDFTQRVAQAAYGLCFYPFKTVWPGGLIPLYLIDQPLNPWSAKYVVPMILVVALTALLVVRRRRLPGLLAAWAAFVALLLPVLGFAVNGMQIAADRYTYLSMIPASLLVSMLLARRESLRKPAAVAALGVVLVVLGALSFRQSGTWKDSMTLWNHALEVDPTLYMAWANRGATRMEQGDVNGALGDYDQAIRYFPSYEKAWSNRAAAHVARGEWDAAIADCNEALKRKPRYAEAFSNRGVARANKGDVNGAIADYSEALSINSNYAEAYGSRGMARQSKGDLPGAIADFEAALRCCPPAWAHRRTIEGLLAKLRK
jgi:Flp pilus assembly protein TadD